MKGRWYLVGVFFCGMCFENGCAQAMVASVGLQTYVADLTADGVSLRWGVFWMVLGLVGAWGYVPWAQKEN